MAYEDRERTPIGRAINDVADRVAIMANKAGIALDVVVGARPRGDMAKYAGEMAEFQRDKAVWRGAAPERIEPGFAPTFEVVSKPTIQSADNGPPTLRKGSDAYHLVAELQSNLGRNLGYYEDTLGKAATKDIRDSMIGSINRAFSDPEAKAFLVGHGYNEDHMVSAARHDNVAMSRGGLAELALAIAQPSTSEIDPVRTTLTGDWFNSLSGMIESRVSLGESSAGHHYAVNVMQHKPGGPSEIATSADGTVNGGWSKAMPTAGAAWKAGVAIADRAIAEPKSAAQTTAFQKSFDTYVATLPQPSQSQRDSARTTATAQAPASVAQRQPMAPVARASLS